MLRSNIVKSDERSAFCGRMLHSGGDTFLPYAYEWMARLNWWASSSLDNTEFNHVPESLFSAGITHCIESVPKIFGSEKEYCESIRLAARRFTTIMVVLFPHRIELLFAVLEINNNRIGLAKKSAFVQGMTKGFFDGLLAGYANPKPLPELNHDVLETMRHITKCFINKFISVYNPPIDYFCSPLPESEVGDLNNTIAKIFKGLNLKDICGLMDGILEIQRISAKVGQPPNILCQIEEICFRRFLLGLPSSTQRTFIFGLISQYFPRYTTK